MDLAGLTSCRELTPEHSDEAVRSLEKLRSLVARVTEIVTVEITGDDTRTLIDVFKEEGWGIKERLIPQARFRVPLDEFERAVEISAKRFAPLKVSMTPNKIVLSTAANATAQGKPPAVELDEKSVGASSGLGMPKEPEPFELPAAAEPEPFDGSAATPEEGGFGAFVDTPEIDDPFLAAAVISPKKREVPEPPPTKKAVETAPEGEKPKGDPVHNRPTVRRMVAIKPEALRTGRKDPRREEDD
jgi:hypothetical protein